MNRRTFVQSLTSGVALAFAAPQLALPEQAERRIYQLDRTMVTAGPLDRTMDMYLTGIPAGNFTFTLDGYVYPVATWPPDLMPYPTWGFDD